MKTKTASYRILPPDEIERVLRCAQNNQELEGFKVPDMVIELGRRLLKKEITWEQYRKEALLAIR